ncbi:putative nadph-ferrihemoprotein reductase [Phaeomoniella chlamydospora]|uniref:NADPH--hemoprotein reductase n=1 Tax=Phaeomoniella chlamydospora TaxID=158046 RepID=A0A0G2F2B6_PHACM|nr:putative nadph-ferrihemoprotein reductase [Phaeomoniella chlamydospora]
MHAIKELQNTRGVKSLDTLNVNDQDLLAVALGAPARQVLLRAEEVGSKTGWRDGYLSREFGFCPPDANEAAGALANSPGRVWSNLCERMPGCVARGRARESIAALPIVEGTADIIPDRALWAALVALGMLCSIYRYEEKHNGSEGINLGQQVTKINVEMSDALGDEVKGIPRSIGLPYVQVSLRMGRQIPHLTFFDQSSYNIKVIDAASTYPYVGRFDNTELRWPMFGDSAEIAFLKGCAETSASFQHGVDAIAGCQEHVMNRNEEGLLCELIRLKEILERMPNAFHSISLNENSGKNYVSPAEWVRWAKFSAPLSKRCPATSGLQFPPYLLMDAFLGRKKYDSFLGAEGVHLRAWLPSNLRAFIAAIEYHYPIPEFVAKSNNQKLKGVLDGVVEAYTGERGFMGTHRYKVFGLLEVAAKTGRTETNGNSGSAQVNTRPWEETHQAFSDAMKERLEPFRGPLQVQPHEIRGTFEECRYMAKIHSRSFVDSDPERSLARVTIDIQDTGITFQPGDRLAIMPLNSWQECAKVAAALGLVDLLDMTVELDNTWQRFAERLYGDTPRAGQGLTVKDILRRGRLGPLTKELVTKLHSMLRASSSTILQLLATNEWPINASLGDLLQAVLEDTPSHLIDQAFSLSGNLSWLCDIIPVEVPRTYSISNFSEELLPSYVELTVSRSCSELNSTFAGGKKITRHGVSSGFLNPPLSSNEELVSEDETLLVGVSRPFSFQLPVDTVAPCAFFAGGSGIAPFRSFWQARAGRTFGRNILYLGVQSRAKLCYEDELRQLVNAGFMEVHTAFSRDRRGLVYDEVLQDLVEREMEPRYLDSLIIEQGQMVCDLVMSKKQGGQGGHLYVCGSLSVFDTVMSGIRKAIYNHRTATMQSADMILNTAFAERRFMLDVFMTPKSLPYDGSTIPLSALAKNTAHRQGGRLWIAVHGKVYDVTDFGPMHPGGSNIIRSNAGVDCSNSFDLLAHTTNPEVTSLLNKYFVGHLRPRPEFHHSKELNDLYDLWAGYLRTCVETLVAHQFEVGEMGDIMESSHLWFQGDLFNMGGVRRFYHYQSRLLLGGFSALFGAKLQEIYLKLSFALVSNVHSPDPQGLPDVLGIIARAKSSASAVKTSKEISQIGQFICDSEAARFHERGILTYARSSVQLDIELLEDIREEACQGMDALDSVMGLDAQSDSHRTALVSTFLVHMLERMAKRLEIFYSKVAQSSVYHPRAERHPARTRWQFIRSKVRDGTFLTMIKPMEAHKQSFQTVRPEDGPIGFDKIITQIQRNISSLQKPTTAKPMDLTEQHMARAQLSSNGPSTFESYERNNAIQHMSTFMKDNMSALRRYSRNIPADITFDQLENMYAIATEKHPLHGFPTPPSSRSSSRSPTGSSIDSARLKDVRHDGLPNRGLPAPVMSPPSSPPTVPSNPTDAIASAITKMNLRMKSNDYRPANTPRKFDHVRTPSQNSQRSVRSAARRDSVHSQNQSIGTPRTLERRATSSSASSGGNSSLRTLKLVTNLSGTVGDGYARRNRLPNSMA